MHDFAQIDVVMCALTRAPPPRRGRGTS